jgi:hypothetical protein
LLFAASHFGWRRQPRHFTLYADTRDAAASYAFDVISALAMTPSLMPPVSYLYAGQTSYDISAMLVFAPLSRDWLTPLRYFRR